MSSGSFHQILPYRTSWNGTAGALQGTLEKQCASVVVWRRWKSRQCVLTPDGRLLVYVGLCAGRSFDLRTAKMVIVSLHRKHNSAGYRQPTCLISVRSATGLAVTLRVRGDYDVAEWSRRILAHTSLLGASLSLFVDDKNTQTTLGINPVDHHFLDRLRYGNQKQLPFVTVHEQIFRPQRSTRSLMQLPVESTTNIRSPPTCAPTAMAVFTPVVPNSEPSPSEAWHSDDSSTLVTSISTEAREYLLSLTTDGTDDTAWPDPPSNLQPPIAPEWMNSEREAVSEVRKQFAFLDNEHSARLKLNGSPAPSPDNIECRICRSNARGLQLRRWFSGPL